MSYENKGAWRIQTLNAISPVYREVLDKSVYTVGSEIAEPDAIMVRSADMHEAAIPESLLCVGRAGAGVNNIPLDRMAESGVVVFNTPGANANAVKELVVAGLLMASRRITEGVAWCQTLANEADLDKLVEKGKKQFAGPELAGKTLGVVGLGAIGVQVANTGVALGMNVLGYDPFISVEHAWNLSRAVVHCRDLGEVLSRSDYLSLHVPLMDSTRGMIDADAIGQLKRGAALLNFSRGPLVDTHVVIQALEEGHLRAYVTDFPSKDLIGVEHVVLTPHLGASTPESEDNCVRMVSQEIREYLENGSITNSVNFPNCKLGPVTMPRIAVLHRNVPKVIGGITEKVAAESLNIENMVNQSRKEAAYTVLDVNGRPSEEVLRALQAQESVFRVRLLMP